MDIDESLESTSKLHSKRLGREIAMQYLFSCDMTGEFPELGKFDVFYEEEMKDQHNLSDNRYSRKSRELAEHIIAGVALNLDEIDEKIKEQKRNKERVLALLRDTATFYVNNLRSDGAEKHVEYILKRGIPSSTVTRFGIGASLDYDSLPKFLEKKGYTEKEMLEFDDKIYGDYINYKYDLVTWLKYFSVMMATEATYVEFMEAPAGVEKHDTIAKFNNAMKNDATAVQAFTNTGCWNYDEATGALTWKNI